jgi:hypothetical protein
VKETYYLFFTDTNKWFYMLLKPRFAHVVLLKQLTKDYCLEIHPRLDFLELACCKDSVKGFYEKVTRRRGVLLKVIVDMSMTKPVGLSFLPMRWGLFTCMAFAKYALGIHKMVITPWQLYKYLKGRSFSKENPQIISIEEM